MTVAGRETRCPPAFDHPGESPSFRFSGYIHIIARLEEIRFNLVSGLIAREIFKLEFTDIAPRRYFNLLEVALQGLFQPGLFDLFEPDLQCALLVENFQNYTWASPNNRYRNHVSVRGYDFRLLDQATNDIVETARRTGSKVVGPIPLPTRVERFTVLRSPHVNKKSREQFEMRTHKRLLDIVDPTAKTVDKLKELELAAGVEINIVI